MITEIEGIGEHISDDTIVWKYMALKNLLFLIRKKKLHFKRFDHCEDKEGEIMSKLDKELFHCVTKEDLDYWKKDRKRNYVNCWVGSPVENVQMWQKYAPKGVAIRTTVGNIKVSCAMDNEHNIKIGRIRYIDFETESSHYSGEVINYDRIYMTKDRKSNHNEMEIRLLFSSGKDINDYHEESYDFDVDTEILVNKVYLSPLFPSNYEEKICNELEFRGIQVQKSRISPTFLLQQ